MASLLCRKIILFYVTDNKYCTSLANMQLQFIPYLRKLNGADCFDNLLLMAKTGQSLLEKQSVKHCENFTHSFPLKCDNLCLLRND